MIELSPENGGGQQRQLLLLLLWQLVLWLLLLGSRGTLDGILGGPLWPTKPSGSSWLADKKVLARS